MNNMAAITSTPSPPYLLPLSKPPSNDHGLLQQKVCKIYANAETCFTVFIGNIPEGTPNYIIRNILNKCGRVKSWKRMASAFGFADFFDAEGALCALRVLHGYTLVDDTLVVQVNDSTKAFSDEFHKKDENETRIQDRIIQRYIASIMPELKSTIINYTKQLRTMVDEFDDMYLNAIFDDKNMFKAKSAFITREISKFRELMKEDDWKEEKTEKEMRKSDLEGQKFPIPAMFMPSKRTPYPSREREREQGRILSHYRKIYEGRNMGIIRTMKKDVERHVFKDAIRELDRQERKLREREILYEHDLQKWQRRERRAAQEQKRDYRAHNEQRKNANHVKEYFQKNRDKNVIYYKDRDFKLKVEHRRCEAKANREVFVLDRNQMKKMKIKNVTDNSGKNPNAKYDRMDKEIKVHKEPKTLLGLDKTESKNKYEVVVLSKKSKNEIMKPASVKTTVNLKKVTGKSGEETKNTTHIEKTTKLTPFKILEVKDNENGVKRKKLKIDDRQLSNALNCHDKKQIDQGKSSFLQNKDSSIAKRKSCDVSKISLSKKEKAMIEANIPKDKKSVFEFPLDWTLIDQELVDQKIRPWMNKKIIEYIGEPEEFLVDYICSQILTETPPQVIVNDIQMMLDEAADTLIYRMWKLLIYESESKKILSKLF